MNKPSSKSRIRKRGDTIRCPKCGGDMFVYSNRRECVNANPEQRTHPHFCNRPSLVYRTRYYKCDECGATDKRASRIGEVIRRRANGK